MKFILIVVFILRLSDSFSLLSFGSVFRASCLHGRRKLDTNNDNIASETIELVSRRLAELRNDDIDTVIFPTSLSAADRAYVHEASAWLGFSSKSSGSGKKRCISVHKLLIRSNSRIIGENALVNISFSPETQKLLKGYSSSTHSKKLAGHVHGRRAAPPRDGRPTDFMGHRSNSLTQDLRHIRASHCIAQARRMKSPGNAAMQRQRRLLPAHHYKSAVCSLVKEHSVVLVSGETGCGKSTQVPQFLLDDEDIGPQSRIVITQPRRLSAISVAERVAKERGESVGDVVGFNIRMEQEASKNTQCLFVTPGVLLRKIMSDPTLEEFSHIIIDEAHERDRFTEFLLIVLRDVVRRRPSLRLILMSATLHTNKLSDYFGGVPHVHMGGSMYPVQEFFLEHALQSSNYLNLATTSTGAKSRSGCSELGHLSRAAAIAQMTAKTYSCPLCQTNSAFKSAQELATHVALCTGSMSMLVPDIHGEGKIETTFRASSDHFQAKKASQPSLSLEQLVSSMRRAPPSVAPPPQANIYPVADDSAADAPEDSHLAVDEDEDEDEPSRSFSSASVPAGAGAQSATSAHPSTWAADFEGSDQLLQAYQASWDDSSIDYDLIHALIEYSFDSEFCREGSILVFLPGWEDISRMHKLLSSSPRFGDESVYKLIQLHSGIPRNEQREVFRSLEAGQHKIILSTNIAETSVTIDDVSVVIDSGKLKERVYDPHIKLSFLKASWISRAAARQRVGRAGRTKPGVCFHLYSKARCLSLSSFQDSELLRMPLDELVLQTKCLGLAPGCGSEADSATSFLSKALDPPHPLTVANAIQLLTHIGCLTDLEELTVVGKAIAALPMDPKLGRAILMGCLLGCGTSLASVISAMGYRDPFIMPVSEGQREACNSLKRNWTQGYPSDQMCLLTALNKYSAAVGRLGFREVNRLCDDSFLSRNTMQALKDINAQLFHLLSEVNIDLNNVHMQKNSGNLGLLTALIGMSLYPNVAVRHLKGKKYVTEKGVPTIIHRGSINSRCASFVEINSNNALEIMGFEELVSIEAFKDASARTRPARLHRSAGKLLHMKQTTPLSVLALLLTCGTLRVGDEFVPTEGTSAADAVIVTNISSSSSSSSSSSDTNAFRQLLLEWAHTNSNNFSIQFTTEETSSGVFQGTVAVFRVASMQGVVGLPSSQNDTGGSIPVFTVSTANHSAAGTAATAVAAVVYRSARAAENGAARAALQSGQPLFASEGERVARLVRSESELLSRRRSGSRVLVDVDAWLRVWLERDMFEAVQVARAVLAKALDWLLTKRASTATSLNGKYASSGLHAEKVKSGAVFPDEIAAGLKAIATALTIEQQRLVDSNETELCQRKRRSKRKRMAGVRPI